jgi:2-polyprenyl-3-methyl-5-hydroxy-6-metoxy-1,4-benzoquinol methylase
VNCRHCNTKLLNSFIDLGSAPPSNSFLNKKNMNAAEKWYPLHVMVCKNCWLVQTEDFVQANEIFSSEYAYFSSFSSSFLLHAKRFVEDMVSQFSLDKHSTVVEVAANDGYLLQYVKERGIPCYGIEPTTSTAYAARERGIDIVEEFFGSRLADDLVKNGRQADLTVANNVLAHVPDINDFVSGFAKILKEDGVATFENPHLLKLVEQKQFDTIYHEHYSYLSVSSVIEVFKTNGLTLFDVEELPVHGGSLRYYAQRSDTGQKLISDNVRYLQEKENKAGMKHINFYQGFQASAELIKINFLAFLIEQKSKGNTVVAYGAAAKGNTMLNFCGVKQDLIKFIVDKNPAKQGKYMPGSRIPIKEEKYIRESKPDYIVILPWNLKKEVIQQLNYIREWGGQFVITTPEMEFF